MDEVALGIGEEQDASTAADLPVVVAPAEPARPAPGGADADAAAAAPKRPSWMFPVLLGSFAALVALLYRFARR